MRERNRLAALEAIEHDRVEEVERLRASGFTPSQAEEVANKIAAHRRREQETWEAMIARYMAAGLTRAKARQIIRAAARDPREARAILDRALARVQP